MKASYCGAAVRPNMLNMPKSVSELKIQQYA